MYALYIDQYLTSLHVYIRSLFFSNIMFFNTDQQTKVFRILFLNCIRSQVNEFIQNIIFIRKISTLLFKVNKFT